MSASLGATRTTALAAEPLLDCVGLRRCFGGHLAVDDVSLAIAPGEAYGLLGPNGAGKTTTISMLCGLLVPDAGRVVVAGVDAQRQPAAAKARIGFVPQDIAVYPDLTARENLAFVGRLYGLRGARLRERIDAVLDLVDLAGRAGDRAATFSGGMKRRLNIAAGLLHEPELLVLDEPTVGVDAQSRAAILERIGELGRAGTALLYTSHYMAEVEAVCDRIGIIDHGAMIAEGTRGELVARVAGRDRVIAEVDGDVEALAAAVGGLAGVDEATTSQGQLTVLAVDGRRVLAELLDAAARTATAVVGVEVDEPDLEAVFLHLTGRALRD